MMHIVKKPFLAFLVLATSAANAPAAELEAHPVAPVAPPVSYVSVPPVLAIYDWSGFYIGLNGGGGWSHKCWSNVATAAGTTIPVVSEGCHNPSGGLIGGQIGYRWQGANWVFGLEGQGDWASFKGSNTSLFPFVLTNQTKISALGLLTAQLGYSWNNLLWYGKFGGAVTSDKYNGIATATGLPFDQATEARWGGAIGTGVEVGFATNWSAGVEYDHLFMGDRNLIFTTLAGLPTRTDRINQDVDIVTVRVNYRFGGTGFRY